MNEHTETPGPAEHRVLILAAESREGEDLRQAIAAAGLQPQCCHDTDTLCDALTSGAAAAVVAGEALEASGTTKLEWILGQQPEWSDIPLILLADEAAWQEASGFGSQTLDALENVAILERPIGARSLVGAVKLAVRARDRQYAWRQDTKEHQKLELRLHEEATLLGERVDRQADTLRLMFDVAGAANFADSVEDALSFAIKQVCRYTGWASGYAFLPSKEDPTVLVPVTASAEQSPGGASVLDIPISQDTLRVTRGIGLVGRVYASGRPDWTREVVRHIPPDQDVPAAEQNATSAAAFPIMAGTEAVGVLAFFTDAFDDPGPELLDAMTSIGTQLGRVIERDRLDDAVRESHRLITQISETSPTLIRIFDESEHRYTYWNDRMVRFFGIPAGQAIREMDGQINSAVHPDDLERLTEARAEVRRPGRRRPVAYQVRMRNAKGAWRWVRTWSTVFAHDESGVATQVLSISIDVTDEVEVEEKLRQTERLTSIGTLAAGLAHEINNPLSSVVITAQVLRKMGFGDKADEMLDNIIQDAKRCSRIVRSVQKFARQEPSDRSLLDLNAVVRAAAELSRATVRQVGAELRLELAERLPGLMGDATELEQVVVNLITNAVHASNQGQDVRVCTSATEDVVRLKVRDEGCGMSPEAKRRVFDPFFTTRGREGGTGLGLSIAHGIVEEHKGAIDVDSAAGSGTTVTVTLPTASASGPTP